MATRGINRAVVNVFRRHGAKNGILPKIRVRSLMLWMLYLTRYRPWMTYRNRMNLLPMTISTPTHETEVNPWK